METCVAMELCEKVQVEEYVIHVVGSTSFYTQLRFSLLASTWFPRPMGVCLWSALHMFLVLFEALMLLVLFSIVFVLAVLVDAILEAFLVALFVAILLASLPMAIFYLLVVALIWLWLLITCQCCTMPGRAPGQDLGEYLFTAGGTLHYSPRQQDPQPAPTLIWDNWRNSFTIRLAIEVIPYWREKLGDLCREIVPWYDTIVI